MFEKFFPGFLHLLPFLFLFYILPFRIDSCGPKYSVTHKNDSKYHSKFRTDIGVYYSSYKQKSNNKKNNSSKNVYGNSRTYSLFSRGSILHFPLLLPLLPLLAVF